MRCTKWEQITPLLFLCWPGCCMWEVPALCASAHLLKKVSQVPLSLSEPLLGVHTVQPSGKSIVYLGHGQSWPVMAHLLSQLRVLPGSPKFSGTVPTGNRCLILRPPWTVCCLLPFYPPSDFLCLGLSWRRPGTSPPSEGRELLGCCHCPNSPPVYPRQRGLQHQAQGPSRWPIKPSY